MHFVRFVAPVVGRRTATFGVVVLAGARQVGKTTLLRSMGRETNPGIPRCPSRRKLGFGASGMFLSGPAICRCSLGWPPSGLSCGHCLAWALRWLISPRADHDTRSSQGSRPSVLPHSLLERCRRIRWVSRLGDRPRDEAAAQLGRLSPEALRGRSDPRRLRARPVARSAPRVPQ